MRCFTSARTCSTRPLIAVVLAAAWGTACSNGTDGSNASSSAASSSSGGASSSGGGSGSGGSGSGASAGSTSSGGSNGGSSGGSGTGSSGPVMREDCLPDHVVELPGGCMDDAFEPNDTATTPATLTLGGTSTVLPGLGSCPGADGRSYDDWYRFTVPAGSGVRVTIESTDLDADLDAFMADETAPSVILASSQGTTGDLLVPVETLGLTFLAVDTTLLLHVVNKGLAGPSANVPGPATYALRIDLLPNGDCLEDEFEENDNAATPVPFPSASAIRTPLTACANDPDHYVFTVPNPGPARVIRLRVGGGAAGMAVAASITDVNGTVTPGVFADGYSVLTFDAAGGASYVLTVATTTTAPGSDYQVELARGWCVDDALDNAGDDSEGTAVAADGQPRRSCETDPDYHRFSTFRSGTVDVNLRQVGAFGPLEGVVFKQGLEGTPVGRTSGFNPLDGTSRATVNVETDATYYVRVSNPLGLGATDYVATVTGLPLCQDIVDEPNDTVATATPLAPTGSAPQVLCGDANDDHFSFSPASPGARSRVGVVTAAGAALDLALTDSAGVAVPSALLVGPDGRSRTLLFDSVPEITYVLRVHNPNPLSQASYVVRQLQPLPANDTCATAVPLAANQSVTGTTVGATDDIRLLNRLCTGHATGGPDVMYSVTVGAGQELRATLVDTGTESEADLALYLLDSCESRCCWGGVDSGASGDGEALRYRNTGEDVQALVLVVDGFGATDATSFGLTVSVQ